MWKIVFMIFGAFSNMGPTTVVYRFEILKMKKLPRIFNENHWCCHNYFLSQERFCVVLHFYIKQKYFCTTR